MCLITKIKIRSGGGVLRMTNNLLDSSRVRILKEENKGINE